VANRRHPRFGRLPRDAPAFNELDLSTPLEK
jgi:hypothetical protein